ncbi:hypothetical protein HNQ69_000655 [Bartonella callosciuri]|uniref:Protein-disulfide reductase n=1 Tax=Bartonella callosciuri TaxID=686223 RepID=A0A840NPT5_9HYPH|nr:hypothetical protein [Bartonella callosciuri]MBB5073534.1 hypothetical protein [Bartonella callosciuri]
MVNLFKNRVLGIFLAATFSLFQISNVNANYLKSSYQQETFSVSLVEQEKNKVFNTAALYTHSFNDVIGNEAAVEGNVEKIVGPLALGFGILVGGYTISTLIDWIIKIVSFFV